MNRLKLIGDSILAYMPKTKLNGIEERFALENAPTSFLERLYPQYKDIPTDINIFCLGINDFLRPYYDEDFKKMTLDEIVDGLTKFISKIKKDNNGDLMVLSILPIRQTRPWSTHYPTIIPQIPMVNTKLQNFCENNNINFVDAYSKFVDEYGQMREDLSDDGIHPNYDKGYPLLSNLINQEIQKINEAKYCNCRDN